MAVIEDPNNANAITGVDSTHKALRASIRPVEVLGWQSIGAQTGLITGIAAGGSIFTLRNASANVLLIRRVSVGAIITTAFTAAQKVDFALAVARAFSANDTGGTTIGFTGNNCKHRTSLTTLNAVDCRISTTTALGAGTRTVDVNRLGNVGFWAGAVGAQLPQTALLTHDTGDYPLVLAANEGLLITNETLMGATGVAVAYVNVEFGEAATF
jgi:hypothetical protein